MKTKVYDITIHAEGDSSCDHNYIPNDDNAPTQQICKSCGRLESMVLKGRANPEFAKAFAQFNLKPFRKVAIDEDIPSVSATLTLARGVLVDARQWEGLSISPTDLEAYGLESFVLGEDHGDNEFVVVGRKLGESSIPVLDVDTVSGLDYNEFDNYIYDHVHALPGIHHSHKRFEIRTYLVLYVRH